VINIHLFSIAIHL